MKRSIPFVFAILLAACGRAGESPPADPRDATAPSIDELIPVLTEILATDWQTEGQWGPPFGVSPPEVFVRKVARDSCRFRQIDLDGDGECEIFIDLFHSPGVPGNRSFHIIRRDSKACWVPAGTLQGNSCKIVMGGEGWAAFETTWRNNIESYTWTLYKFEDGRYVRKDQQVQQLEGR